MTPLSSSISAVTTITESDTATCLPNISLSRPAGASMSAISFPSASKIIKEPNPYPIPTPTTILVAEAARPEPNAVP